MSSSGRGHGSARHVRVGFCTVGNRFGTERARPVVRRECPLASLRKDINTHAHTHIQTHSSMQTDTHTHVNICTHTQTHTQIHIIPCKHTHKFLANPSPHSSLQCFSGHAEEQGSALRQALHCSALASAAAPSLRPSLGLSVCCCFFSTYGPPSAPWNHFPGRGSASTRSFHKQTPPTPPQPSPPPHCTFKLTYPTLNFPITPPPPPSPRISYRTVV